MPLDFTSLDIPLAELSKEVAKVRGALQSGAPDLLFHYTSANGLRGILESSRLWATNYRFLNDASEVAYGVSLFEALIQERLAGATDVVLSEFLSRTLRTANAFDGMFDCYIACFCERDDLLNQWRTYAGSGGGFALGLKTQEVGRRCGQLERTQDFVLRRVVYDVAQQRSLLSVVIDGATTVLASATQGVTVAEANNVIARCCQFLRAETADYLLSFKHPAFEIEKEWRLCHIVSTGEEGHLKFREGPFGLTPYVCLDVTTMAGVNHNKLPLSRITHGPVANPENVRFALNKLLRSLNYAFVEVAGSTLPVRVGA
ncbi:MAG: DUF2971 domain-containing protein [Rhodoferax sp.]